MSKQRTKLTWWLGAFLVVAFVVYAGYFFEAWTGFPKGVDVYARMTRVKYILDFFPHVNWQYHWANGLPTFTTEGPFFYYLAAVLVKLTGISIETSMIVLGGVSFLLLGIGVYGYVFTLSKSITAALATAFLVLSSFSVWSWLVQGGIYPRIFAVGLMAVVLWLLVLVMGKTDVGAKRTTVLLIGLLAALLTSHILIGLFTFAAIFFHLLFSPLPTKQRFNIGITIFGGSLALSAFLYLPLLTGFSGSSSRFIGVISPVLPMAFSSLIHYGELGPVLLPALGLAFLLTRNLKATKPLLLMLIFFVFYGFVGHLGLSGKYYYINGFIPFSAALFICLFGALITGLMLGRLLKVASGKRRIAGIVLVSLIFLASIAVIPVNVAWHQAYNKKYDRLFIYDSSNPRRTPAITQKMGSFPAQEFQYRFAPFDALEAVWFNYVYQTPQERDYYGQGILHPDWRYWFEQALWNPQFSQAETKMALDWFSIRWFTEAIPNLGPARPIKEVLAEHPSRYIDNPDYKLIQSGFIDWTMLLRFENPNPSPILTATNVEPVLIIGDEEGQNTFFRDLSLVDLNSRKIISLFGKNYVDDYRLEELTPFKLIVLYNYRYHSKEKAFLLLETYVKQGGNLIWETANSLDADGSLPEPAPVSQLKKQEVKKAWDFASFEPELTTGVDLNAFSPMIYKENVWRVSWAVATDFRSGTKGILGKDGQWVAVSRDYGKGKIIWTGFNFLYHISMQKNLEEAQLLAKMLTWLGVGKEKEKANFQAEFVHPEKRVVSLDQPARGVLFKENYYPKWRAYLEGQGRQEIFQAGPGMMYVLLPAKTSFPAKLVFEYQCSLIDLLGITISVLTLVGLMYYLFKGSLPFRLPFLKTMTGWWEKGE